MKSSLALPEKGPHVLIKNQAFNYFWTVFVSPRESIRRLGFISKLSNHLAGIKDPKAAQSDVYPAPPHGYGLSEAEVIFLMRGRPRGLLEDIMSAIDFDDSGVITAMKLDCATRSMPADAALRDTLLLLAFQGAKRAILPPVTFRTSEQQLLSEVGAIKSNHLSQAQAASSPTKVVNLFPFRAGAEEVVSDATQIKLESLISRGSGWSLVVGPPGVGSTSRVLAASRAYLHRVLVAESQKKPKQIDELGAEDEDAEEEAESDNPIHLSVFYVDLRGAESRAEIMSAMATQLGTIEGGGVGGSEEAEQRVIRLLSMAPTGSMLILDHVSVLPDKNDDGSASGETKDVESEKAEALKTVTGILFSVFGQFATTISIVLVANDPTLIDRVSAEADEAGDGNYIDGSIIPTVSRILRKVNQRGPVLKSVPGLGFLDDEDLNLDNDALSASGISNIPGGSTLSGNAFTAASYGYGANATLDARISSISTMVIHPFDFIGSETMASLVVKDKMPEIEAHQEKKKKSDFEVRVDLVAALSGGYLGMMFVLAKLDLDVLEDLASTTSGSVSGSSHSIQIGMTSAYTSSVANPLDAPKSKGRAADAAADDNDDASSESSSASLNAALPSARRIMASILSHSECGMRAEESLVAACLAPLIQGCRGCPFDIDLGWALCKPHFTSSGASESQMRKRFNDSWAALLRMGWLIERPPVVRYSMEAQQTTVIISSLAIATKAWMSEKYGASEALRHLTMETRVALSYIQQAFDYGVDIQRQWDRYYLYWAEESVRLNNLLRVSSSRLFHLASKKDIASLLRDVTDGSKDQDKSALDSSTSSKTRDAVLAAQPSEDSRMQVVAEADLKMPHIQRLFALWSTRYPGSAAPPAPTVADVNDPTSRSLRPPAIATAPELLSALTLWCNEQYLPTRSLSQPSASPSLMELLTRVLAGRTAAICMHRLTSIEAVRASRGITKAVASVAFADGGDDKGAYVRALYDLGQVLLMGTRQEEWLGRVSPPLPGTASGIQGDGPLAPDATYGAQAIVVLQEAVRWLEIEADMIGNTTDVVENGRAPGALLVRAQHALAEALIAAGRYEAAKQVLEQVLFRLRIQTDVEGGKGATGTRTSNSNGFIDELDRESLLPDTLMLLARSNCLKCGEFKMVLIDPSAPLLKRDAIGDFSVPATPPPAPMFTRSGTSVSLTAASSSPRRPLSTRSVSAHSTGQLAGAADEESTAGGAGPGPISLSALLDRVKAYLEEAKDIYTKLDGPLSLRAADADLMIGELLRSNDRLVASKEHYENALRIMKQRGDSVTHVRVGHTMAGLAAVISEDSEQRRLAHRLCSEAVQAYSSVLPEDHPVVMTSRLVLANAFEREQMLDEAREVLEDLLRIVRSAADSDRVMSILPQENRSASSLRVERERRALQVPPVLIRLALVLELQGQRRVAEPLYQEAVTTYRDINGVRHFTVAETLCLLAPCIDAQGVILPERGANDRYDEAVRLLREAESIFDALGFDHPRSPIGQMATPEESERARGAVRALRQQAMIHQAHRQFDRAKECFESVMRIYREVRVGICDDLADSQIAYARLLVASAAEQDQSPSGRGGDLLEARTLYEHALKLYRRLHGELHVGVGASLVGLGGVHMDLEEYEEALPYFDDALIVFTETCGAESLEIADCHNCLGSILQALDVKDEAKEAYKEALRIYLKHYGRDHAEVAKVTNNFATLLDDMGEKEEAMFFYDQALTILKRVHGESHPQVVVTLDNLASLLDDMGMRKEALEVEDQADAIAEKLMADEKAMKERASSIHTSSTVAASSRRPRSTRSLHSIGMGSLPVDDLLDEDDQLSQRRTGCTIM